jgi:adenine-specific DNA-methyltransferase
MRDCNRIKANGIFYTPEPVAQLLADLAIDRSDIKIFDPSCGEASLLTAAYNKCRQMTESNSVKAHFVGCDLFKPKTFPAKRNFEFFRSDFFNFKSNMKYDLILTNPPYIQFGRIPEDSRKQYYKTYGKPLNMSKNMDLWAYFLFKSSQHLNDGGSLAAILPWSLLEADYSSKIRKWFLEQFSKIKVLVLKNAHFESTEKRVLLVWLSGFGRPCESVKIAFANSCSDKIVFHSLEQAEWMAKKPLMSFDSPAPIVFDQLDKVGFSKLENYADIRIGVVTGANDYFILNKQLAISKGFSEKSTIPIITSVKELDSLELRKMPGRSLIQFDRLTIKKHTYIRIGKKNNLDKRTHCKRRKHGWYKVDAGEKPDAMFTYRVSLFPYLVLNPHGFLCTNSLHKLYFKNLSQNQKKWLQISLLSIFGQLSLEYHARHYGDGIIKIEPGPLKYAWVYVSDEQMNDSDYISISDCIKKGDKEQACIKATELVVSRLGLDSGLIKNTISALNDIRLRRGAPKLDESKLLNQICPVNEMVA